MNILITPDSFKDCLPAIEVSRALCNGIKSIKQNVKTILFPMADGGEGTTEILNYHLSGRWQMSTVSDPLKRPIKSRYLLLNDRNTAVIELAKASGLELLRADERNPLLTTTFGTGELIRHALDHNVEEILLTIGGSATVDGGAGIAATLGFRFFDKRGREFIPTGGTLLHINRIEVDSLHSGLKTTKWVIASDVQNILNGPSGAARVYGPQKGADADAVSRLADGLAHLSNIVQTNTGFSADDHPGSGAAGGAALFLMAYAGATLRPGFEILAELTNFHSSLGAASIVITGEGTFDEQTGYGKVVASVARLTRQTGIPLIVVCGKFRGNPAVMQNSFGIASMYSIRERVNSDAESITNAEKYLEEIGADIARRYIV